VPSQNGLVLLCLQAQKNFRPDLSAVHCTGVNAVTLWLPSQKGWLFDSPQAHHQYSLPASTITGIGSLCAIVGVVMSNPFEDVSQYVETFLPL
jgi:hypothetical protein